MKKLSDGYGISGKSAYGGIFTAPVKVWALSFSSQLEDYCEIFCSSGTSSILFLELPDLNERKKKDDVQLSKIDYSGFQRVLESRNWYAFWGADCEPKQKHSFTDRHKTNDDYDELEDVGLLDSHDTNDVSRSKIDEGMKQIQF